jgi:hypothetical protein
MGTDNKRSMSQRSVHVHGHTFWRAKEAGRSVELTSTTGIEIDGTRCRWTVRAPGAADEGIPVESDSPAVNRFLNGVVDEMRRIARRGTLRPVPKPQRKPPPRLPASAPVPCPLCSGEAWPDCELCDGTGAVTQRQAAEWQELHR